MSMKQFINTKCKAPVGRGTQTNIDLTIYKARPQNNIHNNTTNINRFNRFNNV